MRVARVNGVELAYEVTGEGFPVVWCHPFGDDARGWESQVRFFSRRYRNIAYNHRGYPPSSAPEAPEAYSQRLLLEDLVGLLDHLELRQAHVVGMSMGAGVALGLALTHPQRCAGVVVAGAGIGRGDAEKNEREVQRVVEILRTQGMQAFVSTYRDTPAYRAFRRKDPRGWAEFNERFLGMPPRTAENSQLGIRRERTSLASDAQALGRLTVPVLLLSGDEDAAALEPALLLKRELPCAGLAVFPQSGHAINLEEPELFNRTVLDFFHHVEKNSWAAAPNA